MTYSSSFNSEKIGLPPGTLVHVGETHESQPRISIIDYSKEDIDVQDIETIDEILQYKDKKSITWVNIEGLKNVQLIESIG